VSAFELGKRGAQAPPTAPQQRQTDDADGDDYECNNDEGELPRHHLNRMTELSQQPREAMREKQQRHQEHRDQHTLEPGVDSSAARPDACAVCRVICRSQRAPLFCVNRRGTTEHLLEMPRFGAEHVIGDFARGYI
jgi:hypothetical protein